MNDKFWKELDTLLKGEKRVAPPPGDDWFTMQEFATRFKLTPAAAVQRVKRLYSKGLLEKVRPVPNGPNFYRPVKKDGGDVQG